MSCNPLHSKINLHLPHATLFAFPMALTRKICLRVFFKLMIISFILMTLACDLGEILRGEIKY